jgi:molybdopterin-guanine dinucleotide biosynthesis protein A
MGHSKATLFLERVVAAARPVFARVIAVERTGGSHHSIPTIFEASHENEAAAFGVAAALEDSPGRCFILATDFPLITEPFLRFLRGRFEASNSSMLVPMWDGTPQVLCAGYALCVNPLLASRIAAGRYDLQGVVEESDVEFVEEAEIRSRFAGEPLLNVNTPADLAAAERYL